MSTFHAHDPAAIREAAQQLNEEAAANFGDPAWRAAKAAEMTTKIYEDFQYDNILPYIGATENLSTEDRSFVREVKGLEAFWVARGGYIEQSTVRTDIVEIPRDTVGFHVSEHEDKMETGFAESSSTMVQLGTDRLSQAVNVRAKALLDASRTVDNETDQTPTALDDLDALNNAIRTVKDETKTGLVTILGRSNTTEAIVDAIMGTDSNGVGYLPETNEQILRTGVLGVYRGCKIVTLGNNVDGNGNADWDADDLYVAANDTAKFAYFGGLKSREYLEQDNWYWHYIAKQEFGGLVHWPNRSYRINVTAP